MHLSVKTDNLSATTKDVIGVSPGMRNKQSGALGSTMGPSPARKTSKAHSPARKASLAKHQATASKKTEKKEPEEEKALTSPTSI